MSHSKIPSLVQKLLESRKLLDIEFGGAMQIIWFSGCKLFSGVGVKREREKKRERKRGS